MYEGDSDDEEVDEDLVLLGEEAVEDGRDCEEEDDDDE